MLTTVDAVIDALGGTSRVSELCGVTDPAVSNWRLRGRIPSDKYLIFSAALSDAGESADASLFGFEGVRQ